ncbi:MAG: DEAD/DEAH box helicase, partial [Planctomycetota bacterium]
VRGEAARRVRRWISGLEDRGQSSAWRLMLRVNEPITEDAPGTALETEPAADETDRPVVEQPTPDLLWSVSFHVQSQDDPDIIVDAADIWSLSRESVTIQGFTLSQPQELLLGELGRASRIFKKLESALDESEPIELTLRTEEAYEFLREYRPLLTEQGFAIESPGWWQAPAGRLGTRLRIDSDPIESMLEAGASGTGGVGPQLGLSTLVGYHWEIAIGDTTLTLHEFEKLAQKSSPLVRVNGRWVEIRPEDVKAAVKFIGENPGGDIELSEAMRLAYSADVKETGVPVLGLDASGWVASLLGMGQPQPDAEGGDQQTVEMGGVSVQVPTLETPEGFIGTLRPYQLRGLSWLAFIEKFGFGACLADDMGLGKTIQLLALLVHEREAAQKAIDAGAAGAELPGPTLLIAPMSVIGNWLREASRFGPGLNVQVHHGVDRHTGDDLVKACNEHDMTITTYALAHRDNETLAQVPWFRLVLDEAQFIKNPSAKQSVAVRGMSAKRRIALTGTPVENRLSELWSIMDFLNPGYLGTAGTFRRKFSVPVERYRDQHRSRQLRSLVRPFILRRVKTDPTVVADLPEKLETREYTHLTTEQAQLYESCVKRMLTEVEQSEGIHRRGVVLAALIRLKQICNHPSQILKDFDSVSSSAPSPTRSGKCIRLMEMMDEVLAEGERALIFTQFRQMGHLLAAMVRHELGRDVLFLHGGTPKTARERMVDEFQDPESKKPILLLSLKAGGVGLNLTAATHVFHFDRWWNPAVENQATDRAYRIGQTRTVHVHKFVVRGTLEERIDEMIESKTELAQNIIGEGERWLTELDTDQLKDILTLRADAIGDEE